MLLDDPCGNGSVDRDGWDGKAEGHRGLQTPISEDLPTKNSARDPRRFLIGILIGSKEHHPYTLLHEGEKKKKKKNRNEVRSQRLAVMRGTGGIEHRTVFPPHLPVTAQKARGSELLAQMLRKLSRF